MLATILTGLLCLVVGWLAGRRQMFRELEGGRDTDPLPPLTDAYFQQLRTERLTEEDRARMEWDRQYRVLTLHETGGVWRRRPYEITDFNN